MSESSETGRLSAQSLRLAVALPVVVLSSENIAAARGEMPFLAERPKRALQRVLRV